MNAFRWLFALNVLLLSGAGQADGSGPKEPRSRTFQFRYEAAVKGLKAGQDVKVWVPVPPSTPDQKVREIERTWAGPNKEAVRRRDAEYGNEILHFTTRANARGEAAFRIVYAVTRREVRGETGKGEYDSAALLKRFREPDSLVPIKGKPLELLEGKKVPEDALKKARLLYDVVNDHMRYSKEGKGWGRGDSVWACDSKYGNCTDFHSLFISLARAEKFPARFEIGFGLPEKRGEGTVAGYHCWAFFRPEGKGWVPVDISEANKNPKMKDYYFGNLTEDRVTFSTGRDITLVPATAARKPLNFFVYPYAEAGGKEVPQERIDRRFTFKDEETR